MIPYGRQDISPDDIAAVVAVLQSEWLTQGPAVPRFEQAIARHCQVAHAVAVNSATSALHIACRAIDLGPGDVLWTSPITFVASANCALYCGASVDFVDIDPMTYNMSVSALEQKLVRAKTAGKLPKVVVPVHFGGQSCDMAKIGALAERYGFHVIEDASHAIGAAYEGAPVGNCRYSDIAILSFHPVKIITSAEGGMALTNDPVLADRMALLRTHGITRAANQMVGTPDGPWYYEQIDLGYNYRMTDVQAALGYSQMQRLDEFVQKRHVLADRYDAAFTDLPLQLPVRDPRCRSALHLYPIRIGARAPRTRAEAFAYLRERGVGVNVHYIPVYRQPYYQKLGFAPSQFPESERYYAGAVSLPMFPALTPELQAHVIDAVRDCFKG